MSKRNLKNDDKLVIRLMLRILDGEKTPYSIPIETDIPKDVVSGIKQGDVIPVLIDRLDPKKVEINLEMLSKEPDPKPSAV